MTVVRAAFLALSFFAACAAAQDASPTHVVLVLADDLGLGDLGAYGRSKIPTPHLDRLAREGLRLTDAHSPSAVCTPTRYGLLTGRYAWRTRLKSGVLWGSSPNLIDDETVTLPEALRDAGAATYGVGKWHLGLGAGEQTDWSAPLVPGPLQHGFDHYFGIPASLDMTPYVYVLDEGVVEPADATVEGSAHRRQGGGGFWRGGAAARDFRHVEVLPRCEARAVEWIERHGREQAERPFFMYLPLTAPHTPWVPAREHAGTTDVGHYGDFVAQVDATVGRLLDLLDALELADDTIVIVTSDNGSHWPAGDIERWGHDGNLGYRGQKADVWEGGHRVPFLVRWPGRVPAGATSDALTCLTDVMPTLAGLFGVDLPAGAAPDGVDQSAHWRDPSSPAPRASVVHHSLNGMFGYRSGDWKLIVGRGSGGFTGRIAGAPGEKGEGAPAGQLYDLASDPYETVDLYAERPDVVERLTRELAVIRGDD